MRSPAPVGSKVTLTRKKSWQSRFLHYRNPPTIEEIEAWVKQFSTADKDIAARVLDAVQVVTRAEIELAYTTLMDSLKGWNRSKAKRVGEWRFVPYSRRPGESGDQMTACFRQAMGMRERYYDSLFVHGRDLLDQGLQSNDTVVFLDDFAGTGSQARKHWENPFKELAGGAGTAYLMVVAATTRAQDEIRNFTDLKLLSHYNLMTSDDFFSPDCHHFSDAEKEKILHYSSRFFPDHPKGYSDSGLLFVFQHDCPNNSIPLLHSYNKNKWVPLFPRTNPPK